MSQRATISAPIKISALGLRTFEIVDTVLPLADVPQENVQHELAYAAPISFRGLADDICF